MNKLYTDLETIEHTNFELIKVNNGFMCTIRNNDESWFSINQTAMEAIKGAVELAK